MTSPLKKNESIKKTGLLSNDKQVLYENNVTFTVEKMSSTAWMELGEAMTRVSHGSPEL